MAPGVVQSPTGVPSSQEIIRPTKQVSPVSTPVSSPPPATVSTVTKSRKPNFHDEADRLRSFGTWPSTAPIAKDKVARAGFYYLGSGLEVACPFCAVEIGDWNFNDVALRKHRDRSPNCPFVLKRSQLDVPLEQIMKSPEKRLETFEGWPKRDIIDPQRLVDAGFFYLKEDDKVRCAWCKGVIERWNPGDVPFDEHAKNFVSCPFILNPPPYALRGEDVCGIRGMCSTSKTAAPSTYPKGAMPHSAPKHPNMVSSSSRMATFEKGWPTDAKVEPADLVEAGFFFLGLHDYTKCFSCDGGLCNWEEGDNPWVEHARWFPSCNFVQLNKGETFVKKCRNLHQQMMNDADLQAVRSSDEKTLADNLRNELEVIMSSPSVKFFLDKEVPPQVIRMTLKKFMLDQGRGFSGNDEMSAVLSQVLSFSKKPGQSEAKRDNSKSEEIPENMLCRVCMVHERGVVFLPCGHFVTCPSCAASVTECVMCRKPIVSTVRTFFS